MAGGHFNCTTGNSSPTRIRHTGHPVAAGDVACGVVTDQPAAVGESSNGGKTGGVIVSEVGRRVIPNQAAPKGADMGSGGVQHVAGGVVVAEAMRANDGAQAHQAANIRRTHHVASGKVGVHVAAGHRAPARQTPRIRAVDTGRGDVAGGVVDLEAAVADRAHADQATLVGGAGHITRGRVADKVALGDRAPSHQTASVRTADIAVRHVARRGIDRKITVGERGPAGQATGIGNALDVASGVVVIQVTFRECGPANDPTHIGCSDPAVVYRDGGIVVVEVTRSERRPPDYATGVRRSGHTARATGGASDIVIAEITRTQRDP